MGNRQSKRAKRKDQKEKGVNAIQRKTTVKLERECTQGSHENSTRSILSSLIDDIKQDYFESYHNTCNIEPSWGKQIETVYDGVANGSVLGYGIGGIVREVTHKVTGTKYALKCLSLDQIDDEKKLTSLREEIGILLTMDHPNIVKLEGVYESNSKIYIVQELCLGGDLFDRLDAQPEEHYSESECARLVRQMLSAVRYIHSKGIVHRDLKLENFLFEHQGADSEMKMIDFGLSKHFKRGDVHHEPVGTRYTVAPEVLLGSYDEKVDIWAIGVLTFLLLSGNSPFGGCGEGTAPSDVRNNILMANYAFEPEEYWSHVSGQAKAFIKHLLVIDSKNRPSAKECQESIWLKEWSSKEHGEGEPLKSNVIKALRSYRKVSDMRKLLCEVIGFTLLPDQISDLRREFEKLDVEQTGEISLSNLKQVLTDRSMSGSLGEVTEEEVEQIFNSLRLRNDDTHVHWHEFLAAELGQVLVDDRNHQLAFDRLDTDHKGFITFDDLMTVLGPHTLKRRTSSMKLMWTDTLALCKNTSRIEYDEFAKIMEEQESTMYMTKTKSEDIPLVLSDYN